jgi:hypothetical protein
MHTESDYAVRPMHKTKYMYYGIYFSLNRDLMPVVSFWILQRARIGQKSKYLFFVFYSPYIEN